MPASLNTHPEAKGNERALLIAHELVDNIKVREVGANRGFWVQKFLASVGLGGGFAWCAAFVHFCLVTAGVPKSRLPKHPASVIGWYTWAKAEGRLTDDPQRGDLFFWLDGSHGHIGWFVRWLTQLVEFVTLEGNTNSKGSREGDGGYRKTRAAKALKGHEKSGYISLKGLV